MKIPRNSVDVLSKHLTDACPGDVLEVIGIHDVNVIRALPTELEKVEIRQEFTDIVLELDNGCLLYLEFQNQGIESTPIFVI